MSGKILTQAKVSYLCKLVLKYFTNIKWIWLYCVEQILKWLIYYWNFYLFTKLINLQAPDSVGNLNS